MLVYYIQTSGTHPEEVSHIKQYQIPTNQCTASIITFKYEVFKIVIIITSDIVFRPLEHQLLNPLVVLSNCCQFCSHHIAPVLSGLYIHIYKSIDSSEYFFMNRLCGITAAGLSIRDKV